MASSSAPAKSDKRRRYDRQFRIMFRPTGTFSSTAPVAPADPSPLPDPPPPRRKVSRILGLSLPPSTLVDDLCSKLVEKSSHWALVVLKAPYDPEEPRTRVTADDSRIERVFEISRVPKTGASRGEEDTGDEEEKGLQGQDEHGESSSAMQKGKEKEVVKEKRGKGKGKETEKSTGRGAKGKAKCTASNSPLRYTRAPTPEDSSEDDRHEDDEGFPEVNEKGRALKMQVSEKPRIDFAELQFEHLGGPLWEILTGIQARTKFTNTELKHEAMRIWKRQQNYHLLDNNCQRFCILMAITIRAKNHSLLRVLHGQTVKKQIDGMKFAGAKK